MPVTKNTKARNRDYQQWLPGDMSNGQILGVFESLGRPAQTVTIESLGGPSVIRFNVVQKIYRSHLAQGNTFIQDAGFWNSPALQDEVEDEAKPNINIESGATEIWEEFAVSDIKIVSMSAGLKIKVS